MSRIASCIKVSALRSPLQTPGCPRPTLASPNQRLAWFKFNKTAPDWQVRQYWDPVDA